MIIFDDSKLIEAINKLVESEALVEAIKQHSQPRLFDGKMLQAVIDSNTFAGIAIWISVVGMILTAVLTWIIFNRQVKIMQSQADLAEQQNRINLFEKRYHLFNLLKTFKDNATHARTLIGTEKTKLHSYFDPLDRLFFKVDDYSHYKDGEDNFKLFCRQINHTIAFLEDEFRKIMYLFDLTDEDKNELADLIKRLKKLLAKHKSLSFEASKTYFNKDLDDYLAVVINTKLIGKLEAELDVILKTKKVRN